jgi:hypothetical protein
LYEFCKGSTGGPRGSVNFSHYDTIEIRIFRGTLNPPGWFANIEFLESLHEYCAVSGLRDITPEKYSDWVAQRRRRYINFHTVLGANLVGVQEEQGRSLCV